MNLSSSACDFPGASLAGAAAAGLETAGSSFPCIRWNCLNPSSSAWDSADGGASCVGVANAGVEMETESSEGSLFDFGDAFKTTYARTAMAPTATATAPAVAISPRDRRPSSSELRLQRAGEFRESFLAHLVKARQSGIRRQIN